MRFENLEQDIKNYMKFMSFEAAVRKTKRTHLGRLDCFIDEAAKKVLNG